MEQNLYCINDIFLSRNLIYEQEIKFLANISSQKHLKALLIEHLVSVAPKSTFERPTKICFNRWIISRQAKNKYLLIYEGFFDEFHSFSSELADVIMLSETWLSTSSCHRADKTGGGVSVFIRNCYSSTHMAKFSVCHAYYEICVANVLLSNHCM